MPIPHARRRMSLVLTALAMVAMAAPGPTSAFSIGGSAALRWWRCDHDWHWQGGGYGMLGTQEKGTFDYCVYLYQVGTVDSLGRVQDGDSTSDTYVFDQVIDWTRTSTSGLSTNDSYAKVTLTSSIAAVGGAYTADPTTVTSSTCSPLSLGAGIGGVGISVGPILCDNATLKRDSMTSTSVQWSSSDVGRTPRWDVAYMLKVGQGAKPKFSALLTYPWYTRYQSGTYCGGGWCIPTYSYTRHWYTDPWYVTAP
jgi:hypothetical protein